MQGKSIAECSNGSILQYFWPTLSSHLSFRPLFCLFLSGSLRKVLLYLTAVSSHRAFTALLCIQIEDIDEGSGHQFSPIVPLGSCACLKEWLYVYAISTKLKKTELRAFKTGDWRVAGWSLNSSGVAMLCPWARQFIHCLVLVQHRKPHSHMTNCWLVRKESNQTNKTKGENL